MRQKQNRIHSIDGIRGFSLFGILLANLLIFQYGIWGKDEIQLFHPSKLDEIMYAFTKVLIEGSFMPIFAFIFGYSMIMMKNSLEQRELGVKWHLFRRALILIIFGLLHSTYLWEGDILFLYGVMLILLLVFVNRKPKTIIIWGLSLFLLLGALTVTGNAIGVKEGDNIWDIELAPYVEKTTEIYRSGTYAEIKEHRMNSEDPYTKIIGEEEMAFIALLSPLLIAPMFLIGMYAAKKKVFFQPRNERKLYLLGLLLCFPIGVTLNIISYISTNNEWAEGLALIGDPILALGYICIIALLYSYANQSRLLTGFENVGKLSLTNYIMQTVICTTIFYGYGLGLFGRIGVAGGIILGIAIYTLQILCSTLYLKQFRYGPLEKITRIVTNLSFLKRKKKSEEIVA